MLSGAFAVIRRSSDELKKKTLYFLADTSSSPEFQMKQYLRPVARAPPVQVRNLQLNQPGEERGFGTGDSERAPS